MLQDPEKHQALTSMLVICLFIIQISTIIEHPVKFQLIKASVEMSDYNT